MHKIGRTLILLLCLTACAPGPDPEEKPAAPKQVTDTKGFINDIYAVPGQQDISHWWERINDPLLDNYVDRLLVQNLDIIQAGERIIQARERLNTAYGSFYPTLGLDGSASRQFGPNQSLLSTSGRTYSTAYSANLNTSWQIDLFGKLRRSAQSADATFQATMFDREALVHSMIAELLSTRVGIAVNKNLLDLARKNAGNYKQIYQIVEKRYNLGLDSVTASDVLLAKENYTSTKADTYRYERTLATSLYNLDMLLGLLPGTTDPLAENFPLPARPMEIPVCLPANLIDRRPDLQASALRLQAANANIGVAMADLYPALNLAGSIGFSDNDRFNVFTADQLAGSILGAITTRLFEGGQLRANIRIKESEARELAAAYAHDVFNAVREVESGLKNEQNLTREIAYLQDSAQSLKQTEAIYERRYLSGIIDLKTFLEVQQRSYAAEQAVLLKQQEHWENRVDLYLALGGDWLANARDEDGDGKLDPPTPLPCGSKYPDSRHMAMTQTTQSVKGI